MGAKGIIRFFVTDEKHHNQRYIPGVKRKLEDERNKVEMFINLSWNNVIYVPDLL